MKMKMMLILALAASGCASGGIGPSNLPKTAAQGLWTNKPAPEVAACIAKLFNVAPDGMTITTPDGGRYEIAAPSDPGTAYKTQVSQFGPVPSTHIAERVTLCATIDG